MFHLDQPTLAGAASLGSSAQSLGKELDLNVRIVDMSDQFPVGWEKDIANAASQAKFEWHPPTPLITRERSKTTKVLRGRVEAEMVMEGLPWLPRLYQQGCRDAAERFAGVPVSCAQDIRYGVVLNVQRGTRMRFECHVDSNTLSGVLFLTDHEPDSGGELVIGDSPDLYGVTKIEKHGKPYMPHAGQMLLFDGRLHAHYARRLLKRGAQRVVAPMNFYTEAWPERNRPQILNHHRFGDALRTELNPRN